jgi:hypothetical protein
VRKNAMLNNLPRTVKLQATKVSDYTNYWENRINTLISKYEVTDSVASVPAKDTLHTIAMNIAKCDGTLIVTGAILLAVIIYKFSRKI